MTLLREIAVDLLLASWLISLLWIVGCLIWMRHVSRKFAPFARRRWKPEAKLRVLGTMLREMERTDPNYWRRHWHDQLLPAAFE